MKTLTSPLQELSKLPLNENLFFENETDTYIVCELLINEVGEISFEIEVHATLNLWKDSINDGYSYFIDREIKSIDEVNLLNIYDEEGEEIKISETEKREIEDYILKNNSFEIN